MNSVSLSHSVIQHCCCCSYSPLERGRIDVLVLVTEKFKLLLNTVIFSITLMSNEGKFSEILNVVVIQMRNPENVSHSFH